MVKVYAFTQLWDPRANWSPTGSGRIAAVENRDLCYGTPCAGIYDNGAGLAGGVSSVYLDTDELGMKGYEDVEVAFSVRVAFVGYYNPLASHLAVPPISVRTVLGREAVFDDLVPFLAANGVTRRLDSDNPPMALISHSSTVSIPANRTLKVQLLFDLTPTIQTYGSGYTELTPLLITDWVTLYIDGRPVRSPKHLKEFFVGMVVGWSLLVLVGVAVCAWCLMRRRKKRKKRQQSQQQLPVAQTPEPGHIFSDSPVDRISMTVAMSGSPPSPLPARLPPGAALGTGGSNPMPMPNDTLGMFAAANREYISPELEQKLRLADYIAYDNPDTIPASMWERRYGVSADELGRLREVYARGQAWQHRVVGHV